MSVDPVWVLVGIMAVFVLLLGLVSWLAWRDTQ